MKLSIIAVSLTTTVAAVMAALPAANPNAKALYAADYNEEAASLDISQLETLLVILEGVGDSAAAGAEQRLRRSMEELTAEQKVSLANLYSMLSQKQQDATDLANPDVGSLTRRAEELGYGKKDGKGKKKGLLGLGFLGLD